MMRYLVKKTETIQYEQEFDRSELIAAGVPEEVFTDGDVTADFADAVYANPALAEWLDARVERHGDVQGGAFKISTVHDVPTNVKAPQYEPEF